VLLAAAVGGVFWRQLRKKRRFKTTWPPPITVPLAPRDQIALPPAANQFAGQAQGRPQKQAPWEQPTLVDMWRAQGLPSAENPILDGDRDHARVQHPPAGAYAAPLDIRPPGNPITGRHAVRHPRQAQGKRQKPQ
jgi:hypothetical protein